MASAKEIRAGAAYVEATVKDKTGPGLQAIQARLRSFGKGLMTAGGGLMAVGTAILAPLALAAKAAADYGAQIKDAADRTGLGIEQLQALKFAAEQSGASFEDLETAVKFMQKGGFGGGVEDLMRYADEIAGMSDPAQQTARTMELFGRSGTKMLPMLKGGSAAIRDMMEQARQLGLVMSADDVEAAEQFGDKLQALERQGQMLKVAIGSALIPTLQELIGPVMKAVGGFIEFIRNNKTLVTIVAAVGAGLLVAGGALVAFGLMATGAAAALAALKVMIAAIGAVLGVIFSPIGLVILAVAALAVGLGYLFAKSETGQRILGQLGAYFRGLWERVKEVWGGITAAIKKGDWGLAMKIAWVGLKREFFIVLKELHLGWARLVNSLIELVNKFVRQVNPHLKDFGLGQLGELGLLDTQGIEDRYKARREAHDKELQDLVAKAKETPLKLKPLSEHATQTMGLGDVAKGLFSSAAISQALAVSDKLSDRIARNTEKAADQLTQINKKLDRAPGSATFAA